MSVYIKFTDDNSDSLTHYGVKGMKWRHRKEKALDIAWEIAHPLRGATNETEVITGDHGEKVTRNENRRNVETKTYKMDKNGKWKQITSQKVTKKKYRNASYAGKKALEKIKNAAVKKKHGTEKQRGSVRQKGYKGKHTKVRGARGSNRKVLGGYKGWK